MAVPAALPMTLPHRWPDSPRKPSARLILQDAREFAASPSPSAHRSVSGESNRSARLPHRLPSLNSSERASSEEAIAGQARNRGQQVPNHAATEPHPAGEALRAPRTAPACTTSEVERTLYPLFDRRGGSAPGRSRCMENSELEVRPPATPSTRGKAPPAVASQRRRTASRDQVHGSISPGADMMGGGLMFYEGQAPTMRPEMLDVTATPASSSALPPGGLARYPSKSSTSSSRGLPPRPHAVRTGKAGDARRTLAEEEDSCLKSTAAPETTGLVCDLANVGICSRVSTTWDANETAQPAPQDGLPASKRLTCTRGPGKGVTSLRVIIPDEDSLEASHTSDNRGLMSPMAVQGGSYAWVRGETLGVGSLGTVFKGLDQQSGKLLAVKEVRLDHKLDADLKLKASLENEIRIYKDLHHPKIVSYLGHDYIDRSLYIYLEYMPGGSLAQVLAQFGSFDESLIVTSTRDLLEGLHYLHTRTPVVLHRDLKGANVLLAIDCSVKLTDFGCSKRVTDTLAGSQSMKGSIPWMAPEVIQQTGYGRRSDIWGLGCVIIEMATAQHPWGEFDNAMALMARIALSDSRPPVPQNVSPACQDFISRCTQRDPSLRPHTEDLRLDVFVN